MPSYFPPRDIATSCQRQCQHQLIGNNLSPHNDTKFPSTMSSNNRSTPTTPTWSPTCHHSTPTARDKIVSKNNPPLPPMQQATPTQMYQCRHQYIRCATNRPSFDTNHQKTPSITTVHPRHQGNQQQHKRIKDKTK